MAKARKTTDGNGRDLGWCVFCPACGNAHRFDSRWTFNGDVERPTFSPSMLVRSVKNAENDPTPTCCHSFVTDGQIQYLSDCTHALAGQTVPLEDF